MRRLYMLILFMLLLPSYAFDKTAQADNLMKLERDVAFTTYQDATYAVALLNKETLVVDILYRSPQRVYPVSWSPRGDKLAVVQVRPRDINTPVVYEVCIIEIATTRFSCVEPRPPIERPYMTDFDELIEVTWSADEQKIYFVSEFLTRRMLIGMELATGKAVEVVYGFDYVPETIDIDIIWEPPLLVWNKDLSYALMGVGRIAQKNRQLINLQTQTTLTLTSLPHTQHASRQGEVLCLDFSPENMFAAMNWASKTNEGSLWIYNTDLTLVAEIYSYPNSYFSCPSWDTQHNRIFYVTQRYGTPGVSRSFYVNEYRLDTHSHRIVYHDLLPPIALSPSGEQIVFTGDEDYALAIIETATGQLTGLDISVRVNSEIVWRPE